MPPPPEEEAVDISSAPTFTPFTVAPSILNRAEVVRAMEREYPALLRDAGIGGRAVVFFFIDEGGSVQDFRISESSGHQALDDAALAVADVYRFRTLGVEERVAQGLATQGGVDATDRGLVAKLFSSVFLGICSSNLNEFTT